MDSPWQNFLVTSLCGKRPAVTTEIVERFSLEDNYSSRLLVGQHHDRQGPSDASKQHIDLIWISNIALVIRSREGRVLALYRQSEAQKQLYLQHGDVLLIHLLHSVNGTKTLLSISIVDGENGIDYTVCLVTLPVYVLSKVFAHCLTIFTSHNDPATLKAVVVNREELLPYVRKAFPMADHIISEVRMLQQVSTELSKHALEPDMRYHYYHAFAVCCSTSCEDEFGYAEASLISAPGAIGIYFETTWFERTDIWRALDNLRRLKKVLNVGEVSKHLYQKLAQTTFFK